ncbi:MAG TPA: HD domain-containing protein [Methanothrix sp.]|nr:HD domain-containing protein [Methanothrix sp.]HPT18919.1 HD domain-containing protein [Methanothrix sp.]
MIDNPGSLRDPVHGAVAVDDLEWQLICSPPMQRLRGIKQLGLVEAVYPGAGHTRFEHSVGTMHMAGKIAQHLGLPAEDVSRARLAGLLHDLGHSAFSHAVEGVLSRNPDIQPLLDGRKASGHEQFTSFIIRAHPFGEKALAAADERFGSAERIFSEVADVASGRHHPLGQIIVGDLDADRIDFLLRDSHHSGVALGLVDVDQILQALTVKAGRIVLAGVDDYQAEMSRTAAESMLIARAHHYNALIYHPSVQSMRAMLLTALEKALCLMKEDEAKRSVELFFRQFSDPDLINFITEKGDDAARSLLARIKSGRSYPLAGRFDHRSLPPETRMALSTISRHGRMRKLFEDALGRKHASLVDITVGSGVPRSTRTQSDGFLYDESALAAGLVKSLTRQIAISFFADGRPAISLDDIASQAFKLLSFIRSESYLPIDGLLLLFYSLQRMLSETIGSKILVPRIRNITWLYRTVARLKETGTAGSSGLFDYAFQDDFGFVYSERLFEDIQILVAMGMIYQDQRHYEKAGRWLQRYEYMLTAEGMKYAESIAASYKREAEWLAGHLRQEKHAIPYDLVSLSLPRYRGERG